METIKVGKYEIYKFTFNPLKTNTYLIDFENNITLIVDPANSNDHETEELLNTIKSNKILIVNTHGHFDHIFGNVILKKLFINSKLIIHELDSIKLKDPFLNGSKYFGFEVTSDSADILIKEEGINSIEGLNLEFIHTPGHTKGSICLKFDGFLFSGDTLFSQTVGIAKEYKDAFKDLISSIKEKILTLPENFIIFPGHGENTTIGDEKFYNPFLI